MNNLTRRTAMIAALTIASSISLSACSSGSNYNPKPTSSPTEVVVSDINITKLSETTSPMLYDYFNGSLGLHYPKAPALDAMNQIFSDGEASLFLEVDPGSENSSLYQMGCGISEEIWFSPGCTKYESAGYINKSELDALTPLYEDTKTEEGHELRLRAFKISDVTTLTNWEKLNLNRYQSAGYDGIPAAYFMNLLPSDQWRNFEWRGQTYDFSSSWWETYNVYQKVVVSKTEYYIVLNDNVIKVYEDSGATSKLLWGEDLVQNYINYHKEK